MGLYGALIVLPNTGGGVPAGYAKRHRSARHVLRTGLEAGHAGCHRLPPRRRRLRPPVGLLRPRVPVPVLRDGPRDPHAGAAAGGVLPCTQPTGCMTVATEPYHPAYFLINGRSMPDDMDPNYASQYPHQPYNGNPHMHPGETDAAAHHRPGPHAAPVPRARQPRARAGARRQPAADARPTSSPARCCSRPPPRRARRWTASSSGPARA